MSFRARMTLAYLGVLTLALSAFGFGVYAFVDAKLHNEVDKAVQTQARTFVQLANSDYYLAAFDIKAELQFDRKDQEPGTYIEFAQHGSKGEVLYHTPNLIDTVRLPTVAPGRVWHIDRSDSPLGVNLALYRGNFRVSKPDTTAQDRGPRVVTADNAREQPPDTIAGTVTVARSLEPIESSLGVLRKILLAGGLTVLAVATLLSFLLSAALLRPLDRMRATAQRIGDERDFNRRMPVGRPGDELGRLSVSFNQMLTELERAHADVEAALESQRRFVADASHELRTPLTAIRTNVDFLNRVPHATADDRAAALADVQTEVRRMETLVGDLLALARLESAASHPRRSLRLDHLVADIHRDAVRQAPEGVEVALAPSPRQVWVSGDRNDLRRAIWNLVANALKYTPSGRVDLSLRVVDGMAEVTVTDTGIGIADGDQHHVFDRFWRARSTRGKAGSGLGLAITKWVAQAHGGSVTVASRLGEGSTFTLRLPASGSHRPPARRRGAEPELVEADGAPAAAAHS